MTRQPIEYDRVTHGRFHGRGWQIHGRVRQNHGQVRMYMTGHAWLWQNYGQGRQ